MFKQRSQYTSASYALGIDIGLYAIKMLLLEESEYGLRILHSGGISLPENAMADGVIVKTKEVGARLRTLARACKPYVREAAVAIPTDLAQLRWIDLPRMDKESLEAAAPFEARKYLPYPVEKAEVRIVPLDEEASPSQVVGDENRMRALLTAAQRDIISSRAEVLEYAGLNVSSIEIEAFALLRAVERPMERKRRFWRGQSLAYVKLGTEASGMYVAQEETLRFVRSISWGSRRLTQSLAEALKCSLEEAEKIKTLPGAAINAQGLFTWQEDGIERTTDALAPELERLRREIERLVNYYRSLFPERSYEGILGKVVLCGATAALTGLDHYFAESLQLEVSIGAPFRDVQWAAHYGENIQPDHYAGYTLAFGLARGGLEHARTQEYNGDKASREYVWRRKAA